MGAMEPTKSGKTFENRLVKLRAEGYRKLEAGIIAAIGFGNPNKEVIKEFLQECPDIPGWAIDNLLRYSYQGFDCNRDYRRGMDWTVETLFQVGTNKKVRRHLSNSKLLRSVAKILGMDLEEWIAHAA